MPPVFSMPKLKKISTPSLHNFAGQGKAKVYAEDPVLWEEAKEELQYEDMTNEHKLLLQKHHAVLIQGLYINQVIDELNSDLVLDNELRELIHSCPTPQEKTRRILEQLPRLGELGYYSLRRAVYKQLYHWKFERETGHGSPKVSSPATEVRPLNNTSPTAVPRQALQQWFNTSSKVELPNMARSRPMSKGAPDFTESNADTLREASRSLSNVWETFEDEEQHAEPMHCGSGVPESSDTPLMTFDEVDTDVKMTFDPLQDSVSTQNLCENLDTGFQAHGRFLRDEEMNIDLYLPLTRSKSEGNIFSRPYAALNVSTDTGFVETAPIDLESGTVGRQSIYVPKPDGRFTKVNLCVHKAQSTIELTGNADLQGATWGVTNICGNF